LWKSGEKPVVVFVLGVPVPVFLLLVFVTLLQILMVPVGLPFPQAVVEHLSGDRMIILLIGIAVSGSTFARVLHITRGGMKEKYPVKADGSHKGTIPHYNLSDREQRFQDRPAKPITVLPLSRGRRRRACRTASRLRIRSQK
jgi:hypothetical protein